MAYWRAVLPQGAMLETQYEEVVADVEGQARRLVSYCGLEWDARCLDFHRTERHVRTASLAQVRQPIYKGSVGRWRAYEAFLDPLRAELEPRPPAAARAGPSNAASERCRRRPGAGCAAPLACVSSGAAARGMRRL